MATIRRKNGKSQALIRRAGAPTCSKTFISKSDARKWAIRVEQAQNNALVGVVDKQAINTPLRAYLSRNKTDISVFKASYNVEKYIIGKWQKHEISKLPIGAVTSARLTPVLTDYQKRYKPETIRKDFGVLRHLFNIAKTQWHVPVDVNPVEQLRLP